MNAPPKDSRSSRVPPTEGTSYRSGQAPGETWRAAISLLLFIHLFILVVTLSATLAPSALQQRLLGIFRPYVQGLGFDLSHARLYLTHASVQDVDHTIEVLHASDPGTAVGTWEPIARGVRGGERLHRYQRLADTFAWLEDDEAASALLAQAIAAHYVKADGQRVSQVRCRRHTLQSWESVDSPGTSQGDPYSPSYYSTVYQADVLTLTGGEIRVVKREEPSLEAAPTRSSGDGSKD